MEIFLSQRVKWTKGKGKAKRTHTTLVIKSFIDKKVVITAAGEIIIIKSREVALF